MIAIRSLIDQVVSLPVKLLNNEYALRRYARLSGRELFVRFSAHAFRGLMSICVFSYFPFGFEGRMWDLIVSVPDH